MFSVLKLMTFSSHSLNILSGPKWSSYIHIVPFVCIAHVSRLLLFHMISNLFVSVGVICVILYLKKKILSKMFLLYCLVLLNSILFLTLFVSV